MSHSVAKRLFGAVLAEIQYAYTKYGFASTQYRQDSYVSAPIHVMPSLRSLLRVHGLDLDSW